MSSYEGSEMRIGPGGESDPGDRSSTFDGRRWTIRRIMIVIAILAPLLALSRYPFAFGLVVTIGLIALFVADSIRRGRFERVAWLLCGYPLLPLLTLYLQWGLITRRLIRRSTTTVLDGIFAVSDIGGFLCLLAYVGCVSLAAGAASGRARDTPGLRRAAWLVVILLPLSWVGLFAFAMWDPFGALSRLFH
jgi:hypothetical protein